MEQENFNLKIVEKVENIRLRHKLQKKDFSESIMLSASQYTKLINNTQRVSVETLYYISNIYKISLDYLISDLENSEINMLTNDQSFLLFTKEVNNNFEDDEFCYNIILDKILDKIIIKLNIKKHIYSNQRPLFMLRKILKNLTNLKTNVQAKELLKHEILIYKKEDEQIQSLLLLKIEKLDDFECFTIINNYKIFIKKLESLVTMKLDIIASDFLDEIVDKIKSYKHQISSIITFLSISLFIK